MAVTYGNLGTELMRGWYKGNHCLQSGAVRMTLYPILQDAIGFASWAGIPFHWWPVTMSIRERGKMFSGITEEHWFESVIYLIPGHLEHLWAQNRKLSCPTALSMFFLPLSHCAGMGLVETCREKHSAHLSFIYTHSPNNCPWLLLWPGVMHTGHEAVCP